MWRGFLSTIWRKAWLLWQATRTVSSNYLITLHITKFVCSLPLKSNRLLRLFLESWIACAAYPRRFAVPWQHLQPVYITVRHIICYVKKIFAHKSIPKQTTELSDRKERRCIYWITSEDQHDAYSFFYFILLSISRCPRRCKPKGVQVRVSVR